MCGNNNYTVVLSSRARKMARQLPGHVRPRLDSLCRDLLEKGPVQKDWMNYSSFCRGNYHCHLGWKWAVCWRYEKKTGEIEIYYVGSRESAPCDGRG